MPELPNHLDKKQHDQEVQALIEAAQKATTTIRGLINYLPGSPMYDSLELILADPQITSDIKVILSFSPASKLDPSLTINLRKLHVLAQNRPHPTEIRTIGLG